MKRCLQHRKRLLLFYKITRLLQDFMWKFTMTKLLITLGQTFNLFNLIEFSFLFSLKFFFIRSFLNLWHLIASEETGIFWRSLFRKFLYVPQLLFFDALVVLCVICVLSPYLLILHCLHPFLQYILSKELSKSKHR